MKANIVSLARNAIQTLLPALVFLAAVFGLAAGAPAQTFSYNAQQPLPVFGNGGAAYGNGVYVVAGSGGFIYRSLDGFHWAVAKNPTFINTNYNSVCFAQGLFVACAANGAIATSADGLNWYLQNSGTTQQATFSTYLNGRYYVTCDGGVILYSTNATNWVTESIAASTYEFGSITYGNGKYVMKVYDATLPDSSTYIFSSTTGTNGWTSSQISGETTSSYNFISYLNNKFYCFLSDQHIYISTDGSTWTRFTSAPITSSGYQIFGGTYANGTYYFYGFDSKTYGALFSSPDGTNFVELPKGFSDQILNLVYGNGVFVSVNGESFASSTNATNWVSAAGSYYGLAYNGTNYVAVGGAGGSSDGYIAVSPDFVNWTNVTPAWTPYYSGITYGDGKFAAVGYTMSGFANSVVATSGDGIHWSLHTNTTTADNFYAVATDGNGTFVAGGDNGDTLRSTDDGVTWTLGNANTGGNAILGISYVNSQFVAVGYGGSVAYSANGSSWTTNASYSDTGSTLTGITYGNGTYAMVGADGNYNMLYLTRSSLTSGSWAVPTTPPPAVPAESFTWPISYGNGVFLSFYNDTNNDGYLFTSTNGQTWVQHDLGNTNIDSPQIYGSVFANGAFELAGFNDYTATASLIFALRPGITSAATAAATYGSAFSYNITASNTPTSYGASGLPGGLSVNTASGLISGTPTQSGAYAATIGATNSAGSGTASLAITVAKAGVTISGLAVSNKVFDGTSTATLNFTGVTLNGGVNGDSIALNNTGYTANFSTTNAGNNLAVAISGLTLTGAEATNYTLTQPTGLTANITPAPASITLNKSVQLYSGTGLSVTNAISPAGLPVTVTYNGSGVFPTNVGAYTVVATVNNPNYSGSTTNTLYIAPVPNFVSVKTNNLNQVTFTWNALAQVSYHVYYAAYSLSPPVNWTDLYGAVTATNNLMTETDTLYRIPETNRFYRVELILQ